MAAETGILAVVLMVSVRVIIRDNWLVVLWVFLCFFYLFFVVITSTAEEKGRIMAMIEQQ